MTFKTFDREQRLSGQGFIKGFYDMVVAVNVLHVSRDMDASLANWDSTLKKTGFAGIDTLTPDISDSLPMSVFAAQAMDDQITLLRNLLAV
ncbi:MAG: hypothetical protein Q9202_007388 [Teloschistes flavicans]